MMEPVYIEHKDYLVHAFRAEDIRREAAIKEDIFAVFSDDSTTRYLPGKKLYAVSEAEAYFRGNLLGYHAGKNFLHFITDKASDSIIGMFDLISPELARQHYRLDRYPHFIEFYLNREFQGRGIMGYLLPDFLKQLKEREINEVGAIVNRDNHAAKKLVAKAGFHLVEGFDFFQDFYLSTLN